MNVKNSILYTLTLLILTSTNNAMDLKGHSRPVSSIAWSPDGKKIASGSEGGAIIIWNTQTGKNIKTVSTNQDLVINGLSWRSDGKQLAAGYGDTVGIWDTASWAAPKKLNFYKTVIQAVAYSPDGTKLASCDINGIINIFDAKNFKKIVTIKNEYRKEQADTPLFGSTWSKPNALSNRSSEYDIQDLSPQWAFNSAQIIASDINNLYVLDATQGTLIETVKRMPLLDAKMYLVKNKKLLYKEPLKSMIVHGSVLSPNKKYSAMVAGDYIDIIDANTLNDIRRLAIKNPNYIAWSPDSSKIAVACDRDIVVHILNVEQKSENNNNENVPNDNAPRSLKNDNS